MKTRFDEEYLEDSEYSDNLKVEIRKIAKLNNVSARAATKDSYIKHLLDGEAAAKRAAEAANNGDGAGKGGQEGDDKMPEKFMDPKFVISEDGRKQNAEWEASKKKYPARSSHRTMAIDSNMVREIYAQAQRKLFVSNLALSLANRKLGVALAVQVARSTTSRSWDLRKCRSTLRSHRLVRSRP